MVRAVAVKAEFVDRVRHVLPDDSPTTVVSRTASSRTRRLQAAVGIMAPVFAGIELEADGRSVATRRQNLANEEPSPA